MAHTVERLFFDVLTCVRMAVRNNQVDFLKDKNVPLNF